MKVVKRTKGPATTHERRSQTDEPRSLLVPAGIGSSSHVVGELARRSILAIAAVLVVEAGARLALRTRAGG